MAGPAKAALTRCPTALPVFNVLPATGHKKTPVTGVSNGLRKRSWWSWRRRTLPVDEMPQLRATPPRPRQRAEDRLGPEGVAQLCADDQAGMTTRQLMQTYRLGKGSVLRR